MKKRFLVILSVLMLMLSVVPVYASDTRTGNVPIIPEDTEDWSTVGEPVYTYTDDGYIIESYAATQKELDLGTMLQQVHLHADPQVQNSLDAEDSLDIPDNGTRHVFPTAHSHSIKNISYATTGWEWFPSTIWVRNNIGSGVTVSWATSQSCTAAKTTSLSVGVTDSVVTATIGANYTKSHTIGTSYTITFPVPYKTEGRVRVTFNRPKANFTCVTEYVPAVGPRFTETGSGSALGGPTNVTAQLQTRPF